MSEQMSEQINVRMNVLETVANKNAEWMNVLEVATKMKTMSHAGNFLQNC